MKLILAVCCLLSVGSIAFSAMAWRAHTPSWLSQVTPVAGPDGPEVPLRMTCYKHGLTPIVVTDRDTGKVMFEIVCP